MCADLPYKRFCPHIPLVEEMFVPLEIALVATNGVGIEAQNHSSHLDETLPLMHLDGYADDCKSKIWGDHSDTHENI